MDDLTRRVAERVLGLVENRDFIEEIYGPDGQFKSIWILHPDTGEAEYQLDLTNANHWMMVVEKMRNTGRGWKFKMWDEEDADGNIRWVAQFRPKHLAFVWAAESSDSPGTAICQAALRALEELQ